MSIKKYPIKVRRFKQEDHNGEEGFRTKMTSKRFPSAVRIGRSSRFSQTKFLNPREAFIKFAK